MTDDKERHRETVIKPVERNEADESTVNDAPSPFAKAAAQGRVPVQGQVLVTPAPGTPIDEGGLGPTRHRDPVIGAHVSGYVVKGRLGSGGMGIVYEGEQPMIGKRVAIKVLRPEVADNPDVVERLVAEARAVNQVGHRGIIDVFAFGELPDGRQCIVMEYLDGESLDAILQMFARERRLMPIGDVLIILDEILSALAAAHTAGVIHRDLKPSNIFLCRQRDGAKYVKLLDFGIAKLGVLGGATPVSRASLMVGTPSYMAPEQAKGGNIGPAMDLYAVGVMAFELFTGRLLFFADSVVAVIMAHQNDPPPKPSSVVLSIPDAVDEMVLRLMAKRPEDRYRSADEVRQVVHALRKEFADTTTKRMQLEITISEREKAAAIARQGDVLLEDARKASVASAVRPPPPSAPQPLSVTVPPRAPPPPAGMTRADGVPLEALQTNLLPPREKSNNSPAQLAQTAKELPPTGPTDDELAEGVQKSNRGLIIGLAALVLVLVVGVAVVMGGGGNAEQPRPAEPPKVAADVARVDPPRPVEAVQPNPVVAPAPSEAVAKAEAAKAEAAKAEAAKAEAAKAEAAKAEAAKAEAAKAEAAKAEAAKAEAAKAEAAKVEAAKVEAAKVEAAKNAPATPAKKVSPGAKLAARVKKLDARLAKAVAAGSSVDLYVKQVQKIQSRLDDPTLGDDERDRLESAISRLEQSTDF